MSSRSRVRNVISSTLLLCAATLVAGTAHAQFLEGNDPSRPVLGVLENPALADGASALWVNPAAMAFQRGGTGLFSRSREHANTYTNIMLGGQNGGLMYLRMSNAAGSVDRWGFTGAGGSRHLGIAMGATGYIVDPDGLNQGIFTALDIGALARPFSWLSVGAVARQLGGGESYPVSLEGGLAVRPLGSDMLTVMGGYVWGLETDVRPERKGWNAGALVNVGPGIKLMASVNEDENVMAGLQFEFGNSSAAASLHRADADNRGPYFGVVQFHQDVRRSVLEPDGKIAEIVLSGEITDMGSYSFMGPRHEPLTNITSRIRRAANDPAVACLYVRIEPLTINPGLAEEIRGTLEDFKESSGKPIVAYLEYADDGEYYIASVADSIFMEPMGELNYNGLVFHSLRARGLLEKLDIEPEFVTLGKYKSAPEALTDSTWSEADREQMTELLGDIHGNVLDAVARSRNMPADSVRALIDRAPFTPRDALAVGLIDGTATFERAYESAETIAEERHGSAGGRTSMRQRSPYDEGWAPRPTVAVVFASGTIVPGDGGVDFITGERYVGGRRLSRELKRIREDGSVAAVVLRVNSPGGSGLASEQIWQAIDRLREEGTPVVASFGGVAASGGYYIACGADTIVTNANAITGSIGGFTGKLVFTDLLERIGVNVDELKFGENADIYSSLSSLSDEQRERLEENMGQLLDIFEGHVAEGRDMAESDVEAVGGGRVYSGERSIDQGLSDETGGLHEAIQMAMELGGVEGEAEIRSYPSRRNIWEIMQEADPGVRWNSREGRWLYRPIPATE